MRSPTSRHVCIGARVLLGASLFLVSSPANAGDPKGGERPGGSEAASGTTAVMDLEGKAVDPFRPGAGKAVVLVFIANECPISNRYAPEIRRLQAKFQSRGVAFWLVHPDADESVDAIRRHAAAYQYPMGILRDPHHVLVRRALAHVTPEAAAFLPNGQLVYHGRIDDRYTNFGRARPEATQHDLEAALNAVLDGRPVPVASTRAIGCHIPDAK